MSRMQRDKGKRGELEWSKFLRDSFGLRETRRSRQYCGDAGDCDVVGVSGLACEVKRVESLSIYPAIEKAAAQCRRELVPYVAHRRNNKPWLVTIRAKDLQRFSDMFLAALEKCLDGGSGDLS